MKTRLPICVLLLLALVSTGCNMYSAGYSREALGAAYQLASDQRQSGGISDADAMDFTAGFEIIEFAIDIGDPEHMVLTPPIGGASAASSPRDVKGSQLQRVRDFIIAARQGQQVLNGVTAQAERMNLPITEDGWQTIMAKLSAAKQRWYSLLRP